MLFLTRLFGVTGSDSERDLAAEKAIIEEIVEKVLLLQANSAAQQKRPLGRGTHVKGTTARAKFEVFDVDAGRDAVLGARLAKGIFAKPGVYPSIVRFGNADPKIKETVKRLKEAEEEADRVHQEAEDIFAEADRRLSTTMACEGAQRAIEAWEMREKVIRKLEVAGRI